MPALPVIEDLEVLEERGAGFDPGAERLADEEFALHRREEALGHRIVVAVADAAPGAADADRLTALPEEQRGALAAMVGMVNHASSRPPVPDCHLQRADYEL